MMGLRNSIRAIVLCELFSLGTSNPATILLAQNQSPTANISQDYAAARQLVNGLGGTANPYLNGDFEAPFWVSNPDVINQLQLTDAEIGQLTYSYGQNWSRYQQELLASNENLVASQRTQAEQQYLDGFDRNLMQAAESAIPNPVIRLRFIQLYLQYRWYNAFNDDIVQQQLYLTPQQLQAFQQLAQEWDAQMATWYDNYQLNGTAVQAAFNQSRNAYYYNVYSILNPQQFELWKNLIGEPFQFTLNDYFWY